MAHFADRLMEAVERKRSHVVVGLDPDYALLPPDLLAAQEGRLYESSDCRKVAAYREFLFSLLPRVAARSAAVKIQLAYFEAAGAEGWRLYQDLVGEAQSLGCLVIADAKRGDIGSTAEAYARAHLEVAGADALTVNPLFGTDGLEPFLRRVRQTGKGVFILVKTSNPSSAELQDVELAEGGSLSQRLARLTAQWAAGAIGASGYSSVGAVVGATHPEQALALRRLMPGVPLLIPGYGAQGGRAPDLAGLFDSQGLGAVVNSSRAIIYAHRNRPGNWLDAAEAELEEMRESLWRVARAR
jgi:orotidine-5'-phosphate decarboxylase